MSGLEALVRQIKQIGFHCQRCGSCCQGKDHRVMVYPAEVRALIAYTGLAWDDVAEPYPGFFDHPSGSACTFEWALRRSGDRCTFLDPGGCRAYPCRSWICRTFPFLLEGTRLLHEDCPGTGREISDEEALILARDLIRRQEIEETEEILVQVHARDLGKVKGKRILIDGEGVKELGE